MCVWRIYGLSALSSYLNLEPTYEICSQAKRKCRPSRLSIARGLLMLKAGVALGILSAAALISTYLTRT